MDTKHVGNGAGNKQENKTNTPRAQESIASAVAKAGLRIKGPVETQVLSDYIELTLKIEPNFSVQKNGTVLVTTPDGEKRAVTLPDGMVPILLDDAINTAYPYDRDLKSGAWMLVPQAAAQELRDLQRKLTAIQARARAILGGK